jgi:hypothetical protein
MVRLSLYDLLNDTMLDSLKLRFEGRESGRSMFDFLRRWLGALVRSSIRRDTAQGAADPRTLRWEIFGESARAGKDRFMSG